MSTASSCNCQHLDAGAVPPERMSLRGRLAARWARLTRWEYWPSWTVYAPLLPRVLWLGLRHGGLTTCTLCNPGMPMGGLAGESKWDILQMLPHDAVVASALIGPGTVAERVAVVRAVVRQRGWSWPVVLKPDVGERGTGVKVIEDIEEVREYFETQSGCVLLQEYHPGPCEFGVFYVRMPGEERGKVFSITEKRFASVTGDGKRNVRELVWDHSRYRVQADVLLENIRDDAERVPAMGEEVRVGVLGNHCRGAMFLDGASHITPELTGAMDRIARHAEGFFFGRFDVRCPSAEDLRRGERLKIVELNGLLSESTNIYDPGMKFWRAQRVLGEQWAWAFRIGAENVRRGARRPRLADAIRVVRAHVRAQKAASLAVRAE